MAIISFGQIDKKLIFIILLIIEQTISLIIAYEAPEEYSNDIMCSLEEEIGPIIFGTIFYFIYRRKHKKSDKKQKSFKYLILLFLLRAVKSCYERLYPYFVEDKACRYGSLLNTVNGIEIILMTLGTLLILKYKYYIHHIISMIIYCVLGIVSDIILGNYSEKNYKYIFIYIIYIINEVLIFCYIKYMMDKLYYHYYEVVFYWGLTGFLVKLIIFSSLSIHEYKNNIEGIIDEMQIYFTETNIYAIIFFQFFYYIFEGGLYYLLVILMIYYLRPNHMIITDEFNVYEGLIFYKEKENKLYTLIPFCVQILSLLFYFEILEFNFCGLNDNTTKNIQKREIKEEDCRHSISTVIELGGGQYLVKDNINDNDKKNVESLIENNIMNQNPDLQDDFEMIVNK